MGWHPAAVTVIALCAAGCAVSAVDLRDNLDLNQAAFHEKLATQHGLGEAFLSCTATAYDERVAPSADGSVAQATGHPEGPLRPIHSLIDRIKEGRPAHAASLQVLEETLADLTGSGSRRLD